MSFRTQSLKPYRRMYEPEKEEKNRSELKDKLGANSGKQFELLKLYLKDSISWFYVLGGFFLAQSTLIEGIFPFAIALVIALKKENSKYFLPGFLGCFVGEVIRSGVFGLLTMTAIISSLILIDYLQDKLKFKNVNWWVGVALLYAGINLVPLMPGGINNYQLYRSMFDACLMLITSVIFCQSIAQIEVQKWPKSNKKEEVIPLSFMFVLIILGMESLIVVGLSLQHIFINIIVLIFGYIAGGGIGAASGAILGSALVFSNPNPAFIGALTLGGFLGGVFNDFKKPGAILGFLIGASIMTFYLSRPFEIIGAFQELAIAAIVFMLLPSKFIEYTKMFFPLNNDDLDEKRHLSEMLSKRTDELSLIFDELSSTFNEASDMQAETRVEIEMFMEKAANNICLGCKKYKNCWENNFFSIYRGMVETLSNIENKNDGDMIEDKDLSPHLIKHCLRPSALKYKLKTIYDIFKVEVFWQRKVSENQEFVAEQLKGISDIMGKISCELERELKGEEEIESKLIKKLVANKVPVQAIETNKLGNGRLCVNVKLKECSEKDLCDRHVNQYVSEILGEKMMVVRNSCFYRAEEGACSFTLSPFKAYNIITGVCQINDKNEQTCGDSYLSRQLKSGQHLLLLSDGMGKGEKAKKDSEAAIKLLERLLNSGFDRNLVIKNVNSILNLRNKKESFATMDMVLVDMLTGEGEFYKAGAMPTYIIRENEIQKVEGESLPAGILNNLEPTISRVKLTEEDVLVMVSDGVFSLEDNEIEKDWLEKELNNLKDSPPQVLADELLSKVVRRHYGEVSDDVTIMVSKVKKNFRLKTGVEIL
ncbi:stage II sporulation protein E [Natranaerofaba carboxydovora]|uniref:stage II sporulation protein E n=1 Tax=Natranaerofaba carboxydovora TaxID=2742683 RepID=UPI001F132C69|nr:stage II sporulation protein E [Natranaerofaba carboxydovora]UMZ75285.1 Stage II sporulation protein E [Natranaerofaba carboxydovora]